MTSLTVIVFILVYLGMALGRIPGLAVDRTGVALLGLIVLLASGDLSLAEAGRAIDVADDHAAFRVDDRVGAVKPAAHRFSMQHHVADWAQASGTQLSVADFARCGIPMTLVSVAIAVFWLNAVGPMRW